MVNKEKVIRLFLGFVSRYISLKQAHLATLGGRGVEAKVWSELGVPKENGWLIERRREQNGKLIRSNQYRTHNQLITFGQILDGHEVEDAFVDAFHLDLCGTFSDKAMLDFRPVLPLILKSRGRCLAITVADARRNLALEQWPDFEARGNKLFGKKAQDIYTQLLSIQRNIPVSNKASDFIKPFDPEKATRREFGLLVELTELLQVQGFPWIPVVIERYVYVSRYQGQPFRMRTYFFHFEHKSRRNSEIIFANRWVESQLVFANEKEFQEVKTRKSSLLPVRITTTKKEDVVMSNSNAGQTSRLAELVKILGGSEETEYVQLRQDSRQLQAILAALNGVRATSGEAPAETFEARPDVDLGVKKARKIRKGWGDFSDREKIEWQLKALELKAAANGEWENGQWHKLLKNDFGHYTEELGRSLRAALSRTSGGFRDSFAMRISKVFEDEAGPYLDRLAKL